MPSPSALSRASPAAVLGLLGLVVWVGSAQGGGEPMQPGEGAASVGEEVSYVGEAVCQACHPIAADHWASTVHGRLFLTRPRSALEAHACEACHGPGSRHMADPAASGKLIAFTRDGGSSVESQNEMCLACHSGGSRLLWQGSIHEREDLACSDCHNPMSNLSARGLLREADVNQTCFACHPTQQREFRKRSHMPLLEGKMSCVDCHDPHGSSTPILIRADSINQLCYRCHTDKRGPFLWEHAPVSENCLGCHLPHGSNKLALLRATPPSLCQQCHLQASLLGHASQLLTRNNLAFGGQPDERVIGRGCPNCHSRVHGSNHPSGARLHR